MCTLKTSHILQKRTAWTCLTFSFCVDLKQHEVEYIMPNEVKCMMGELFLYIQITAVSWDCEISGEFPPAKMHSWEFRVNWDSVL